MSWSAPEPTTGTDLINALKAQLEKKGSFSFASRHEICGVLAEEMQELLDSTIGASTSGTKHIESELMDIAVGALFGYICMVNGKVDW